MSIVLGDLSSVRVGGLVWCYVERYGKHHRNLCRIRHIDKKGRLYFCAESYQNNWRYGFEIASGTAKNYPYYTIAVATDGEVEAERKRLADEKEKIEVHQQESHKRSLLEAAAEEMYNALEMIAAGVGSDGAVNIAKSALRKARGEQ